MKEEAEDSLSGGSEGGDEILGGGDEIRGLKMTGLRLRSWIWGRIRMGMKKILRPLRIRVKVREANRRAGRLRERERRSR